MSRRIRVYIAGPITKGDLADNVNQATRAFVELAKAGFAPFCPHWSVYANEAVRGYVAAPDGELSKQVYAVATANGNPSMSHDDWLAVDLSWVEAADAVLRLPGDSVGASIECRHAQQHNIPVFHSVEALAKECCATMDCIANVGPIGQRNLASRRAVPGDRCNPAIAELSRNRPRHTTHTKRVGDMCEVRIVRRGKAPPPMLTEAERNSLVEGIYPLIRKVSRRFRPTPIYDADDVAQEAALSAILRSGSYSKIAGKVAPSTWAFGIVINAVRDHIERQERRSRGVVSFDQHEEFADLLLVGDDSDSLEI